MLGPLGAEQALAEPVDAPHSARQLYGVQVGALADPLAQGVKAGHFVAAEVFLLIDGVAAKGTIKRRVSVKTALHAKHAGYGGKGPALFAERKGLIVLVGTTRRSDRARDLTAVRRDLSPGVPVSGHSTVTLLACGPLGPCSTSY